MGMDGHDSKVVKSLERQAHHSIFRPTPPNKSNQRNIKLTDPRLGSEELSPDMDFVEKNESHRQTSWPAFDASGSRYSLKVLAVKVIL